MISLYVDGVNECVDGFVRAVFCIYVVLLGMSVGEGDGRLSMTDGDTSYRVDADKRAGVVGVVVVGALHQGTLGVDVAESHIHTYWGIEIRKDGLRCCGIMKSTHSRLFS